LLLVLSWLLQSNVRNQVWQTKKSLIYGIRYAVTKTDLDSDAKEFDTLQKEVSALKHDMDGLIEILGLFRAVPYFQAAVAYPEEKEKRDAIVNSLRQRYA
jgi:hypothetical protein